MSYERNLTFNLRIRGVSEDQIAETLDEVRAHEAAAGTPAEAEFGKAEEYAKQFPKMKMRTRGTVITMIGVACRSHTPSSRSSSCSSTGSTSESS